MPYRQKIVTVHHNNNILLCLQAEILPGDTEVAAFNVFLHIGQLSCPILVVVILKYKLKLLSIEHKTILKILKVLIFYPKYVALYYS